MTQEELKIILDILYEDFHLDDLDLVQFMMAYESKTGEKIPDHWLAFSTGRMKTVKL